MASKTNPYPLCSRFRANRISPLKQLQQRLDMPLHNLIELGFRALNSELEYEVSAR